MKKDSVRMYRSAGVDYAYEAFEGSEAINYKAKYKITGQAIDQTIHVPKGTDAEPLINYWDKGIPNAWGYSIERTPVPDHF